MGACFNKQPGFSLIEVVLSFAILASLGVAIVQAQINAGRIVTNLASRDVAWDFLQKKIQEIERNPQGFTKNIEDQVFADDHPLAGNKWHVIVSETAIFTQPMTKITCRVEFKSLGEPRTISSYVLVGGS